MTQEEFSSLLGLRQSQLSRLEAGKINLSLRELYKIKDILGVSSDALLDGFIPYHRVAEQFNRSKLLSDKHETDASIQLRYLYPFIAAFERRMGVSKLKQRLNKIGVQGFIFADPNLTVNIRFFWDVVFVGIKENLFSEPEIVEEIAKELLEPAYMGNWAKELEEHKTLTDLLSEFLFLLTKHAVLKEFKLNDESRLKYELTFAFANNDIAQDQAAHVLASCSHAIFRRFVRQFDCSDCVLGSPQYEVKENKIICYA
jgi:transcriptional regulator with XRE-family HTH domain